MEQDIYLYPGSQSEAHRLGEAALWDASFHANVSSKSWSRYVKLSLAITAMVFDRAVQWNTQSAEPIS